MSLSRFFAYSLNITKGSIIAGNNTNTIGNIFTTGGNVGIGTTLPSSLLDVAGTIRANTMISTNLTATNFTVSNVLANTINYGISSVFSGSFSASNNVSTPTNITGFNFSNSDIRSFRASVTISILRTSGGNLYENYVIEGFQFESGWSLYTERLGDDTGITFNITSQGQMQYTSTNLTNFISNIIRFSISQIANTGTYVFNSNVTQGTLLFDSIQIQNTKNSIIGTDPGSLYVLGGSTFQKGINILTTENAIGLGTGGGLSVLGGGSISKDLLVGGTITTGNLEIIGLTDTLNLTSTNITSGTLTLSTGLTSNLAQITNIMNTNLTVGTARITSNLFAVGNSNTIGSIFTTGGNVGIGTTVPNYLLEINGSARVNSEFFIGRGTTAVGVNLWDIPGAAWRISTGGYNLYIGNGTIGSTINTRMIIDSTGNVGIGTTTPSYTLDVAGTTRIQSSTIIVGSGSDYGFRTAWNGIAPGVGGSEFWNYRGLGSGGFYFKMLNASNQDVGWAPITAGEYTNASDYRIKTNILQIDSNEAIQILRNIKPISYNMKDHRDDTSLKYGFIAQDIENYIPCAVKKSPSIIPNFQQHFKYTLNDNKYELHIPLHNLNNNDKLRINFNDLEGDHEVTIKIKDENNITFEHSHKTSSDTIFLYGSQVSDFRTLDYNMIHTILHSATQNIDNRVQKLEEEKSFLLEKIKNLENRLNQAGL